MSKLDYITVTIVAVCILAIIFLIYKMTDLFKSDTPADKTETVADSVELEDDIYDYSLEEGADSTPVAANNQTTNPSTTTANNSTATKPATAPATKTESNAASSAAEDDTESAMSTSKPAVSEGKYMVLAGAFTKRALADDYAVQIRKKGYANASVEIFDRGKFAVVLVDRYNSKAEADRLVSKLKAEGVNSYIKTKD